MTRVTQSQLANNLLTYLNRNRARVNKLSDDISSGIDVRTPGDSQDAGAIAQYQVSLDRAKSYQNRIATIKSSLAFQNDALTQANDLLIRGKEIAVQSANETNSPISRSQLAEEVFQLRDHLVSLANSQYQGRFVFGGADDDDPPFDAATYTNPSTGDASQRYVWDAEAGTDTQRTVKITDNLSIVTNTPGDQLFQNGIEALERLGRALAGYDTLPASGSPTGGGNAFTFPTDFGLQTDAIQGAITLLDTARQNDILPEQVDIAGRQQRIDTAQSLLEITKTSSQEALDTLQGTDIFEAASELTHAQTALQGSLEAFAQVFKQSILDYL